jgi:hypothetical protein
MDGRTDGQGDSYITPQTLLTDQDEMNNLHRGHSIDASYQVSVHLANRFRGEHLK